MEDYEKLLSFFELNALYVTEYRYLSSGSDYTACNDHCKTVMFWQFAGFMRNFLNS